MAEIREQYAAVVLLGHMNPLIFQPEWLRVNQIIGESEAKAAVENHGDDVIHKDVTQLSLSKKTILVEQGRFTVSALEEPLVSAKDFALGCFRLLPHTPISAIGLNFITVFRLSDHVKWHAMGDGLAPKAPWETLLDSKEEKQGTRTGGMRNLTVERSQRPDEHLGYIRVIVEGVEGSHPDTRIGVNDHYQFDPKNPKSAGDAMDLLEEQWEIARLRAKNITDSIMGWADGF